MVTLEQELVIFHYRLGLALAQWSHVEASIVDVVANLFTIDDFSSQAITAGLNSCEGFRAKLKFADEVVKRKLTDSTHLERWNQLVNKARDSSGKRNNLAHWLIQKYPNMKPGKRVVLRPWVMRKPASDGERSRPPEGSKRIMDLVDYAEQFAKLGDEFQDLFGSLFATGCRLRESGAPKGDRPTVDSLKRQISEEFSIPPKPPCPK